MVQPSPSGRLNMRLDFYLSENSKHWTLLDGQSRLGNLFREDSISLVYFIFPLKRTFCRPWPCLTKFSPNSKTGTSRGIASSSPDTQWTFRTSLQRFSYFPTFYFDTSDQRAFSRWLPRVQRLLNSTQSEDSSAPHFLLDIHVRSLR